MTGGAVIVAAIIAAVAAHKRLRMTLDAERVRLDHQLAAEGERLEKRLRHDREQSDLAELRNLLDTLMGDAWSAYDATLNLIQHHEDLIEREEVETTTERVQLERELELSNAALKVSDARRRVLVNRFRAAARLPDGHAVVRAHNGMAAALTDLPLPHSPMNTEELAEYEKLLGNLWDRHDKLIAACRNTIGSTL